MSWAVCSECGLVFSSDSDFDRHRVTLTGRPGYDAGYDWRCATVAELSAKGWRVDDRGRLTRSGPRPAGLHKGHPACPASTRTVAEAENVQTPQEAI